MTRTVSATEARIHLGELIRDIVDGGDAVVVERSGKPQVVILSVAEYERLRACVGEEAPADWLSRADLIRERIQRELGGRELTPADEVVRAMREERDAHLLNALRRR